MAAALLTNGITQLENVPDVVDIRTMARMLEILGGRAEFFGHTLNLDTHGFTCRPAPYELVKTMRASIYVLSPLLSRFGQAEVALPGGCAIGLRPIDQHIKAWEAMGAEVKVDHGFIKAHAPKGLKGAEIYFDVSSVGATVNSLLAAVLADGQTVLDHAATEPEIANLAEMLNAMGARISGAGSARIVVEGIKELSPVTARVIPDRIEAGTLALAVAITQGSAEFEDFPLAHLIALERKLSEAGFELAASKGLVTLRPKAQAIAPANIITAPYPGFPTDLQAQWMALMCQAQGNSVVTEAVWENRFMHVAELNRMGADIHIEGTNALIHGPSRLSGAPVMASDLRASAALILAALVAEGETQVARIYHLDRGYEHLEEKLTQLHAHVERVKA
jgi:UDP-N-acetylglucosamine 1-carboxyvinyltransferase